MEQWVVVYIANRVSEVHVMQAILAQHGIENRLRDENLIQANPFYSAAVGGVKVEVPVEQAERAFALLHEAGYYEVNPAAENSEAAVFQAKQEQVRLLRRLLIVAVIALICVVLAFLFT